MVPLTTMSGLLLAASLTAEYMRASVPASLPASLTAGHMPASLPASLTAEYMPASVAATSVSASVPDASVSTYTPTSVPTSVSACIPASIYLYANKWEGKYAALTPLSDVEARR